jgi:hypothetical protein
LASKSLPKSAALATAHTKWSKGGVTLMDSAHNDHFNLLSEQSLVLCTLVCHIAANNGRDREDGMVARSILDGGVSDLVIIDMVRVLALLATIACRLGARNWKGMSLDTVHAAFGIRRNSTLYRETKVQGGEKHLGWMEQRLGFL